MPKRIFIKGKHLRVRLKPHKKGIIYRYQDVGIKKHSQRLSAFDPKIGRWETHGWIFPVVDVLAKRPQTMTILRKLGVSRKAQQTVRLAGVI